MTIPATHCEAKKHAYRQTKDGIVISFVLHPNEVPDDLALAPLGARYMLGLARIGNDEEPQEPEQKPKRPGTPFDKMPPSQQAGILCNDVAFQEWANPIDQTPEGARNYVLAYCEITSRRELDNLPRGDRGWPEILSNFRADTGRTAEQR